ncbi:unnamed protein product [Rhizoctonia solani]|uniref:Uncharacterized protein n=1 Tax=Rhizoctonia solani TaxID=456999 RepID=A0A8H2WXW6_9AGAM|nr:unnamed protein product [Rhizoctonia solani]
MNTRKQKQDLGHVHFVEGIWEKISSDSRVRDGLNKMRNFVSNGPFIAIVVGAGGESKPVTFAILPVLGLTQIGRVAQAVEEVASGKPISINTVLTALQSLGAMSVPGMVVGKVVSGAINVANLFVRPKTDQVPRTLTPGIETPTTTSTPELTQEITEVDVQEAIQCQPNAQQGASGAEVGKCDLPSGGSVSTLPGSSVLKGETAGGGIRATESDQGSVNEKSAKPCGHWYKLIDVHDLNPPRLKL